jgi:hypothetical protein
MLGTMPGFSLWDIYAMTIVMQSGYIVVTAVGAPMFAYATMILFPRSARRIEGMLLPGLLTLLLRAGSFYCTMRLIIHLANWHDIQLMFPLVRIQEIQILMALPVAVVVALWVRARFGRLFELAKE